MDENRNGYLLNGDTMCLELWKDGMIVCFFPLHGMDVDTFRDFQENSDFSGNAA